MAENWPGYMNGVSLGGLFVIEDWMFQRTGGHHDPSTLHLRGGESYDNHAWSQDLLKGDLKRAYAVDECHVRGYYSDEDLDELAAFGINAVRLPVGYWLWDHPSLYPHDKWVHEPNQSSAYGVNPDGFITGGTLVVSDMVMRLWNRNIKVILDMHALPGCSSPHQSYAGINCEESAPNYWNGRASDGISGGHRVQRSDDGKTWSDIGWKIALERVVPWIAFVNEIAPGAIVAYELVNEPDLMATDASEHQVRAMTLELGTVVDMCLKAAESTATVRVGVSNAAGNYDTSTIARDYKWRFGSMRDVFWTDLHHYYNWGGCTGPDYQCICDSALPGTAQQGQDQGWAGYIKAGVFQSGWRFYVGEWSSAVGAAQRQGDRAGKMWRAQKWNYMNQYLHYRGKADREESSFLGDFYWSGRMGLDWDPTPGICTGRTSSTNYEDYKYWDWNFLRLVKLGLAQPLSRLGWTPASLQDERRSACSGRGWYMKLNGTVIV